MTGHHCSDLDRQILDTWRLRRNLTTTAAQYGITRYEAKRRLTRAARAGQ